MVERETLIRMVRQVQAGDQDAAATLYETFHNDVYYFILKTVSDPELAADLTQDTFMEILQTIGKLTEPAAFVNWSRQIAYHRCTAHFRKRQELLADEDEDGYSVFDTMAEQREEFIPDEALDKAELKRAIHAMIDSLPEEQRAAVMLRYFDELSVSEIARIQGVSEGTVKSRLNYGRKSIRQAVERYEQTSGVKLRCAGVVPLLLWLLREYRLANGLSLTTGAAAAAGSATAAAAASAGAASAGATGAAAVGAKAAGAIGTKIIAGAVAAAVVAGGAAAVLLQPKEEEHAKPEKSMVWTGYGEAYFNGNESRRFELTVEEMDDDGIKGHITASYLYHTFHDSDFEGTGTTQDGVTVYDVTFETPAVYSMVLTYEYDQIQLEYHEDTEQFILDDFFDVTLERTDPNHPPKVIAADAKWSGYGEDIFYIHPKNDHLFELDISRMTETDIRGSLTVSYNGSVDHQSDFTGRGFSRNGKIQYEIQLETIRSMTVVGTTVTADTLWLYYDPEADTFSSELITEYEFEALTREK